MKNMVFRWELLTVFVWLLMFSAVHAGSRESENILPFSDKPVINVIDSLTIDLSRLDSTICIDDKVVLSFQNDSIFACEWIDMETGDTLSRKKVVTLSPSTTHQYRVNLYYFTGELIENGDFEDESKPENERVDTRYTFVKTTQGNRWNPGNAGKELWGEGTYRIGKSPRTFHPYFYRIKDHTSGKGNMMIVNGSKEGNVNVWRQKIKVEKNRIYAFSTWGVEVGKNNPAKFHFTINGKTLGKYFQLKDGGEEEAEWEQFYELWEADREEAVISLVNLNTNPDGNDFAIDDISFASMEKKTGVITVKVLPAVKLGKLDDVEVCEEEEIVVNAQAEGSGISGYKWEKNGAVLPLSEALLRFDRARLEDAGDYTCSVEGECGIREESLRIDVREKLKVGKLRDTVWPCEHEEVVFGTSARGYLPVYRWTKPAGSEGWLGEKLANYVNKNIVWERDTGTYRCRISSRCGDTTVYRVLLPRERLEITDWPGDMSVCTGTDVRLFVNTNFEPHGVSWGGPGIGNRIEGKELWVRNTGSRNTGIYDCKVTDECLVEDSVKLILQVLPEITRFSVSPDTSVCENGRAVLRASADGIKVKYKWTGPSGFYAETAEVVIDPVTSECFGTYMVEVRDSCDKSLAPGKVELSPLKEYDELNISGKQEVCSGERVRLEVTGGKPGLIYDWSLPDGSHKKGPSLEVLAEEGKYACRISGVCPSVVKEWPLAFRLPLHAEAGENEFWVCPGEDVWLVAEASGSGVVYEWWKAGLQLGENATWVLKNPESKDAGIYECRIYSDCGDTVLYYKVNVKEPLVITEHSQEKFVRKGEKTELFVNVSGDGNRSYQWYLDGRMIASATSNRIDIQVPDRDTVLVYTCKVIGCNSVEQDIRVHVRDYLTIMRDTTVFLCEGMDYSYRVGEALNNGCENPETKWVWVYNGKDTISEVNAITFSGFDNTRAGDYVCTMENDCGKEIIHLNVDTLQKPQIVAIHCDPGMEQDGSVVVCQGSEVRLIPEVKTYTACAYEWRKDGVLIPGATDRELVLSEITAVREGRYTFRVISAVCGEDVKEITLKVYKKLTISYDPEIEKCPGELVILQVHSDASAGSRFLWSGPDSRGWVAENDGYFSSYKHSAVGPEHDGIYRCRVINVCGEDTATFRLTVEKEIALPEVVRHDTVCVGGDLLVAVPVGQSGIKYVWTLPDQSTLQQETIPIGQVSAADTGNYHYQIETKNSCFSIEGDIYIHLRAPLQLTSISPDTAVCEGTAVGFTAYAEGKGVEYAWWGPQNYRSSAQSITVGPVTAGSSGVYEVVVTDICNPTGIRGKVRLSLLKEFEELTMTPDTGICQGSDVTLQVEAKTEGLHYEWSFAGRSLGADDILLLTGVNAGDAGKYTCRISGICQSVDKEVNLQVYPYLQVEKEDYLPVCLRENTSLAVSAIGEQVKYRWMKDGEEKGFRTEQLVLEDVIPADAGLYECHVSSLCGDSTLNFDFRLKETTQIIHHSADRVLCEGDEYNLWVEAAGENVSYFWTCDGIPLADERDSVIHCIAPLYADTLLYTCRVTGDCGVDSISVVIRVGEFRKIKADLNDILCEGGNYKYNVSVVPWGAFEGQGFNYRWTFNGVEVANSTISVFPFTALRPDQAGDYFCEITTLPDAPDFRSATVKLHIDVMGLPEIEYQTPDLYVIEGSRTDIKVVASGDELTYTWTKDGVQAEHDLPEWSFTPVDYDDRGSYEVTVANRCAHTTGKTNLEVWRKTVIVYPQERTDQVCLYEPKDLEVEAWGENGLIYRWYRDGVLLDVPFTEPLQLAQTTKEDEGTYVCVVSGRGGSDTCKIHLNVLNLPEAEINGNFLLCKDEASATQVYVAGENKDRVDYTWQIAGGELLGGSSWGEMKVKWDNASKGQLTLKVTSLTTGCSRSQTKPVRYSPLPEISMELPGQIGYCQDSLVLDRAYPWGGYFTVNGANAERIYFADKTIFYAVEYYYKDTDTGCSATAYDTIRIAGAPEIRLAQDTIRAGWCSQVDLDVSAHTGGTIAWGGVPAPAVVNEVKAYYQAPAYTSDTLVFWATLSDSYHCRAADTARAILLPSPQVSLGPDTLIGICNDLLLRAGYDTPSPAKTEWLPAESIRVLDDYTAEITDKKTGENRFTLIVTDGYGCVGKDTAWVTVEDGPVLESKEACAGSSLLVDVSKYSDYSWEDGYEGNTRNLTLPGRYHVEVADRYGCRGEADYEIHVLPEVHLEDTLIYDGQKFDYMLDELTDYPPYEIAWQDGSHGYHYVAEKEGYYHVQVKDNIGCTAADTAFLEVKKWYIAAPDAFLPSSNGDNSRFYLKEVNFGSHFEMYIYDRWGELLFKTDEIGFKGGWDGAFKGAKCQPGAYVWVAFVDGKEVGRGTLMLVK